MTTEPINKHVTTEQGVLSLGAESRNRIETLRWEVQEQDRNFEVGTDRNPQVGNS